MGALLLLPLRTYHTLKGDEGHFFSLGLASTGGLSCDYGGVQGRFRCFRSGHYHTLKGDKLRLGAQVQFDRPVPTAECKGCFCLWRPLPISWGAASFHHPLPDPRPEHTSIFGTISHLGQAATGSVWPHSIRRQHTDCSECDRSEVCCRAIVVYRHWRGGWFVFRIPVQEAFPATTAERKGAHAFYYRTLSRLEWPSVCSRRAVTGYR